MRALSVLSAWMLFAAIGCYPDPENVRKGARPQEQRDGAADRSTSADAPSPPDAPAIPGGGSDARDATTGAPSDAPRRSQCAQYAEAYCARFAACASANLARNYGTEARCRERRQKGCELVGRRASVTWPTNACITALASQTCTNFDNAVDPPECLFPGGGATGSPCDHEAQCQGRRCVFSAGQACGKCDKRSAIGERCTESLHCASGLVCANMTCVRPSGFGAACDTSRPCLGTLACKAGFCAERDGEGAPCSTTVNECDQFAGLGCNQVVGKCVRFTVTNTCRTNADGTFEVCTARGTCDGMTRECRPAAEDGAACAAAGPLCTLPASCVSGKCELDEPDPSCSPALPGATNNAADMTGPQIGSGELSAAMLRKTLKTTAMVPAGLEVTGAWALGPGKALYVAVAVTNKGTTTQCNIEARNIIVKNAMGGVVVTRTSTSLAGSIGLLGPSSRWVTTCLAAGETGYVFDIQISNDVDMYAAAEQIEFQLAPGEPSMRAPARVLPIAYTVVTNSLQVVIKNEGTTPARVSGLSYYLISDTQGPLRWGFLSGSASGGLLDPGQTDMLSTAPLFQGTADRLRVFLNVQMP